LLHHSGDEYKGNGNDQIFSNAKGFGFAVNSTGEDVFVHHNDILGDGFKKLASGQKIQFVQLEGEKGLLASQIEVVE